MSTTPPASTPITETKSWLLQHERIIIVALVLAFGTFGLDKVYNVEAARADAKYTAAQQQLADAKANSAALALATSQMTQQYQALVQALAAQNASLNASIAQRTASGVAQRTTDASLPVAGVAARWDDIAGTLVTPSGNTIIVSEADAHKTLDMLEQVPTLQNNLADETKIAQNYQQEIQKSGLLSADLQSQVIGLNTQLIDSAKACTLQVATVKAEGKKNSIKWFRRGLIVGFLGGLWAGHAGL